MSSLLRRGIGQRVQSLIARLFDALQHVAHVLESGAAPASVVIDAPIESADLLRAEARLRLWAMGF